MKGAEAVSHADILTAVQEVTGSLRDLTATVGREFHDTDTGKLTATGIFARMRGLEVKVEAKDHKDELERLRWKNRIWGVTATAGICAAVVMWFAGDRIDAAKELVRHPPTVEAKK